MLTSLGPAQERPPLFSFVGSDSLADETVITKLWLLVPYRRHRAPTIEEVWYGGDWGLMDAAAWAGSAEKALHPAYL